MADFDQANIEHLKKLKSQIVAKKLRYKTVFGGTDGEWVLDDLAKSCYVRRTTYDPDEKMMGINEGRRAVYNYIKNMVDQDIKSQMEELTS